jgi:curli biogenesis system outer membrane secretion channel CsgG
MISKHATSRRAALLCLLSAVLLPTARARAADSKSAVAPLAFVGPKRTIAVGSIDVLGPYANGSAVNAGGAVGGMFTTALQDSGRFTVVERDALPQVITEQELAKSHVAAGTSAPLPGNVIPAQYLLVGSVTSSSTSDRGGGFSFGGGGGAITLGHSSGEIGLDLRLIDPRTSAVVKAIKVKRKIAGNTIGVTGNAGRTPVGTNAFANTPLGDATRAAIGDAVVQIVAAAGAAPWRGQVVKFDSGMVWVNAGGESGVRVGDSMAIQRVGETLTDPATGIVLSQKLLDLGVVTITNVEPAIAWGNFAPSGSGEPVRGDALIFR